MKTYTKSELKEILRLHNLWLEANLSGADLRGADLKGAHDIKTFKYERHLAIQYLDRIRIGCGDHTIEYWLENYQTIGQANNHTPNTPNTCLLYTSDAADE